MHFVPSLFSEFIHAIEYDNYKFNDLRWLIYSGEALPMSFMQKWIDKYGTRIGLANLYGPTEASIDVTCHLIEKRLGADGDISIPIGKPIDTEEISIMIISLKQLGILQLTSHWESI